MIQAVLCGDLGQAVLASWRPFALHASQCGHCESILPILRNSPDNPYPYFDQCCEDAQPLFIEWADAKLLFLAHLNALREPWGLVGMPEAEAQERAAAIQAMPGPAAAALFREPDRERREAQIRAVVAAHRAGGVVTSRTREPERRKCAAEDCQTGPYGTHGTVPANGRSLYCCDLCRKRWSRRRLAIESTED